MFWGESVAMYEVVGKIQQIGFFFFPFAEIDCIS